jgi:tetratricopeptide (TPR) repeat protein
VNGITIGRVRLAALGLTQEKAWAAHRPRDGEPELGAGLAASSFFEACSIKDNNPAALIADEPSLLKRSGDERDRCSAYSKHLRQKLLGQRKRARTDPVLRLQQPSGKPRFCAVNGITCGNLLRFDPKHLRVVRDDVFDGPCTLDVRSTRDRIGSAGRYHRGQEAFQDHYARGNYPAAQIEAQKLERLAKPRFGADHPYYAVALNKLGIVVQAQGRYTEAEGLFKRALASEITNVTQRSSRRAGSGWRIPSSF